MGAYEGLSGQDMVEWVGEQVEKVTTETPAQTIMLRFINQTQLYLYDNFDFPELVLPNKTLVTSGKELYDLATDLADANTKAYFGRVKDKSVRLGTQPVPLTTKAIIDVKDPARTNNLKFGYNYVCYMANRTNFGIYPGTSTGDTVYLDFVQMPEEITYTTPAADISFYPEHHQLIVDGAIWMAMKKYINTDFAWRNTKAEWLKDVKKALANISPIKIYSQDITPIKF